MWPSGFSCTGTALEMYFERLLLRITLGPPATTPERVEFAHRKFHEKFLSDTKAGLRSIRRGLDCCLARDSDGDVDRHVGGLRRLWAQFLIVSVANAQIRRSEWHRQRKRDRLGERSGANSNGERRHEIFAPAETLADRPAEARALDAEAMAQEPAEVVPEREKREDWISDKLPARWLWINRTAGLARVVDDRTEWFVGDDEAVEPYLDYAKQMLGKKRPAQLSRHSLAARAFVERHLKLFSDPVCEHG